MKTVRMLRDFDYMPPSRQAMVAYKSGETYDKVPEAAANAILEAGAGEIVRKSGKAKSDD